MHLHAIMASYAAHKQSRQIRYDLERAYALGQEFGIERAAQMVDHCNKEGPYSTIGAAKRIRSLLVRGPSEPVGEISEDFVP